MKKFFQLLGASLVVALLVSGIVFAREATTAAKRLEGAENEWIPNSSLYEWGTDANPWADMSTVDLTISGTCTGCGAAGATVALDNLASTAVNTDIISDTDGTDSLGSTGIRWLKGWFDDLEVTNPIAADITGNAATVTTIAGLAPDTATTQATQSAITSLGTLTSLASGTITETTNAVETAQTVGFTVVNTTAAEAGAQQFSPVFELEGQGWRTDATAETQEVKWGIQTRPVQGTANPTSVLDFLSSINGGAFSALMSLTSSGDLTVGGVAVPTISSTSTLTNKRITVRVSTEASSGTPTINTDNVDAHSITALAAAVTSMTTNLSGTPTNFQKLIVRFLDDGTGRAITWGASFEDNGVALPTTTTANKLLTVGFIYDTVSSKWGAVAVADET